MTTEELQQQLAAASQAWEALDSQGADLLSNEAQALRCEIRGLRRALAERESPTPFFNPTSGHPGAGRGFRHLGGHYD